MANAELIASVKRIVAFAKAGDTDTAYAGYRDLFSSPEFASYRPEDQRTALRLMVLAKVVASKRTPAMIEAHQSAIVLVGNEDEARRVFRTGLALEREHNAQSDLCGAFLKRISFL
jgi:hypothetical protein